MKKCSKRMKEVGKGHAHGKIILGGEHSVVHGKPAIVLPIPLTVEATARYNKQNELTIIKSNLFEGTSNQAPRELSGYFDMIRYIQEQLVIKPIKRHIKVEIDSEIPMGAGLGSSAAVANAIAQSVLDLYHYEEQDNLLIKEAVHVAEVHTHGNPSDLDMYGTFMSHPVWFEKGYSIADHRIKEMKSASTLHYVIAFSGISVETKEVVRQVQQSFTKDPNLKSHLLEELNQVVNHMSYYLQKGDVAGLGQAMIRNHKLLKKMGVSSHILDKMVDFAMKSGALGCKLSGKGIGGSVIALLENNDDTDKVSSALMRAGAAKCYSFKLERC